MESTSTKYEIWLDKTIAKLYKNTIPYHIFEHNIENKILD